MSGIMYNAIPAVNGNPAFGAAAKAFSVEYIKALYDKQGAWKYVRNQTADVSSFGESVTLTSFPRLTAVNVDPSTGTVAANNTALVAATITINKYKAVRYEVPESTFIQAKVDLRSAFASEAARAVSDAVDFEMSGLCSQLTTNTVGSVGTDLTDAIISSALQKLVQNHVSLANPRDLVFILPGSQFAAVRALKNYGTNFRMIAGSTGADGMADIQAQIDTVYGIEVIWRNDTNLVVSGGHIGGLFYRDSAGIAFQRMPTLRPPQYVPGTVNIEMLTWALFGINLLKEEVAVQILTK